MLMRFDPFGEPDRLATQLHDGGRPRWMPLDAYRLGDTFHIDVDLPGVKPESIDVTVERNVLSVKAQRHWSSEDAETLVCERPTGTFSRELFLGESLDTEKIAASYENGVRHLSIPVAEEARARRIEVHASQSEQPVPALAS